MIFIALIHLNNSHDEFVLINNALREYMIWKMKSKTLTDFNSSSKILGYSSNNVTILFKVLKKKQNKNKKILKTKREE